MFVELASLLQVPDLDEVPAVESASDSESLTEQPGYPQLLKAMDFDPCSLGELTERTRLTTAELSSMLLLLELEGLVEALPGGRYCRLPKRTA